MQCHCFIVRGKHSNQLTVNFLADEITGMTFKASSLNFLSDVFQMTISCLANHVNYISDSMDHIADRKMGKSIMLTEKGRTSN